MLTPSKQLSANGLKRLQLNEGCELKAYPDGPKWPDGEIAYSIGYGYHSPEIKKDTVWTQQQADEKLMIKVREHEAVVNQCVTRQDIKQWQFDTFVDFDYNTGGLEESTMLKDFNEGDSDEIVEEQMMRWIWSRGQKSQALKNRRKSEVEEYEDNYQLGKE